MCEFCTQHGEGKKWYLEMKNYSDILLHEGLSSDQQAAVKAETRAEWIERFWKYFEMPAMTGVPKPEDAFWEAPPPAGSDVVSHHKVQHFGQVLPVEDVEKVIDIADSITRMPCGCRFLTTGKTDQRYCFGLGVDKWEILGKYPDTASSLEVLEKEEAKKIIRALDEEGLMHSIWTFITPYITGVCNCDRDCGAYGGSYERRGVSRFFRGEDICQVDWDLCMGCKSCMSQCQFGAQFYSSALGKVYIDPSRCYGCGVCRAACPNEAITLVPRQQVPEAADLWLGERA